MRTPFHVYHRWTPETFAQATRIQLVAWLTWNDPNGEYTTAETYEDGSPAPSTEEYREVAIAQWRDGQPASVSDIKPGDTVKYSTPELGEGSLRFTVLEVNGDRLLMELQDVTFTYPPTESVATSDVVRVDE